MSLPGQIGWDLTVPNAEVVRDFYQSVTGWTPAPVAMGGYDDFCMTLPGALEPGAGICHASGANAGLPPVWLVYITIDDLDESIARCLALRANFAGPSNPWAARAASA